MSALETARLEEEKAWREDAERLGLEEKNPGEKVTVPPLDTDANAITRMGLSLNKWYTWFAWHPVRMEKTKRMVWMQKVSVAWSEAVVFDLTEALLTKALFPKYRPFHPDIGNFILLGIWARRLLLAAPIVSGILYTASYIPWEKVGEYCGCGVEPSTKESCESADGTWKQIHNGEFRCVTPKLGPRNQ